jgi:hypothetical protein
VGGCAGVWVVCVGEWVGGCLTLLKDIQTI